MEKRLNIIIFLLLIMAIVQAWFVLGPVQRNQPPQSPCANLSMEAKEKCEEALRASETTGAQKQPKNDNP